MTRMPAPHPQLAAVIFDCDGVLVDSERITNTVLATMLGEQGLAIDPEAAVQRFIGRVLRDSLPEIEAMTGRSLPPDWYEEFVRRRDQALREQVLPVPGALELVAHLRACGIPYAVASGADCPKMRITLGRCGLLDWFTDRMFGRDMVERGKPHPDVYQMAMQHLQVHPDRTVVIEDTPTGTQAGVAAGARVFGYSAALGAAPLLDAGATLTFDEMTQVPALLARALV